jgi:mannose-1-phosphate guanylyltransferase
LIADNPRYLFVMHCDICSSFPLHDMLKVHSQRGAVLTVMSAGPDDGKNDGFGKFIQDATSLKIVHFTEKQVDGGGGAYSSLYQV